MKLIVETDLGNDPDDFFALCYLINAGVDIKAIVLSPGHPYQIGLVNFICRWCGLDIPVGVANPDKYKIADYTGFHGAMIRKYGICESTVHAGLGYELIEYVFANDPDVDCFAIGPLKNFGEFFRRNPNQHIGKFYMQGGFVGYEDGNDPEAVRMDKFEGQKAFPTFNLNGEPKAGELLLDMDIEDRRFISKNVNHTVLFDGDKYREMIALWDGVTPSDAYRLFLLAAAEYDFQKREKKFHDPTTVACFLHPEIATWVEGRPYRANGGWGTDTTKVGSKITTSIRYDSLWSHIMKGN